jgi:hypothetical protein
MVQGVPSQENRAEAGCGGAAAVALVTRTRGHKQKLEKVVGQFETPAVAFGARSVQT